MTINITNGLGMSMDIVIIEDLRIISKALTKEFMETNGTLSVTTLNSIEKVRAFDFSRTKFIVSDLFLDSTIYDTLSELYQIKNTYQSVKISVFTQSADIAQLPAILHLIGASHLFDKRFSSSIAETVLNEPCQQFKVSNKELKRAKTILSLAQKDQSILENLAQHISLTTIALETNKSKSAISQAVKKIENAIGAKRNFLRIFCR